MSKTDDQRITDAIAYLKEIGYGKLAMQVQNLLTAVGQLDDGTLGTETDSVLGGGGLGLQKGGAGHLLRSDAKTQRRRAVRALILLQAAFLTGAWQKWFGIGDESALQRANLLDRGWVDVSRTYWMEKSEPEIREAIACYAPSPHATPDALANAFRGVPPEKGDTGQLVWLKMTRAKSFVSTASCYGSVMYWMFRSGVVGLPWFLRYVGSESPASLTAAFGKPWTRLVAPDDGPPPAKIPLVPRGYVLHLYCMGDRWKGHWIVCNNQNRQTATGCNNGQEGGRVERVYDNRLSIPAQFADYKEEVSKNPARYEQGIIDVYNPVGLLPE